MKNILYIKQYGLERSGTNYTKFIIEQNIENVVVLSNFLGSKHSKPDKISNWTEKTWKYKMRNDSLLLQEFSVQMVRDILYAANNNELGFILTVKNPFSWCVSFSKRFSERAGIDIFSQSEKQRRLVLSKWLDRWNKLNSFWLSLDPFVFIYEQLMNYPLDSVKAFANHFGVKCVAKNFINPNKALLAGGQILTAENGLSNNNFNKNFYIKKEYMSYFSQEEKKFIWSLIDKNLASTFGYFKENYL